MCSYGGDRLILLGSDERAGEDLQFPEVGPHVLGPVILRLHGDVTLKRGHKGGGVGLHQTGNKHHLWVHHNDSNTSLERRG